MRTYTRDSYRKKAQTCLGWAVKARTAEERKLLLQLADGYIWLTSRAADSLNHGTAHRAADPDSQRYRYDG